MNCAHTANFAPNKLTCMAASSHASTSAHGLPAGSAGTETGRASVRCPGRGVSCCVQAERHPRGFHPSQRSQPGPLHSSMALREQVALCAHPTARGEEVRTVCGMPAHRAQTNKAHLAPWRQLPATVVVHLSRKACLAASSGKSCVARQQRPRQLLRCCCCSIPPTAGHQVPTAAQKNSHQHCATIRPLHWYSAGPDLRRQVYHNLILLIVNCFATAHLCPAISLETSQ